MKKTIRGVTYDTDKAKSLCSLPPVSMTLISLCRTGTGHFFLHEQRYFVHGKQLPYNVQIEEFAPGSIVREGTNWHFAPFVEERHFIKPLTRKQARAWAIRTQMPRTFHKDLARFLK